MKIRIEPLHVDDAGVMSEYANNRNIWERVTDGFPYPYFKEHAIEFIEKSITDNPRKKFKITVDGEFAGVISISPREGIYLKNAEVGYWVAEPFWGKGIATKATKLIIDYTFEIFSEIERIYALVYQNNIGSMKVLLKNGLKQEAKLEKAAFKAGQFVDIYYFRLFRDEYSKN